ncbi:MAG: DUF2939 domain-containing protein [Massilia sp.]
MKRIPVLAAGALLLVAVTSFASPWWTLHSLRGAAARHDGGAVAAQVDFPALRTSVKEQMQASLKRDMGYGAGLAMALVNPLVDAVVTPAGVAAMVEHGKVSIGKAHPAPAAAEPAPPSDKPHYALRYRGWNSFAVTADDGGSFVFRRDGLWRWKLAGIELARGG